MVTLFAFVRRRPGLDREEFLTHWRENHGPLIAGTPELARHIVRYEQHAAHDADPGDLPEGFDGVAVQWYRSFEDFVAFVSEPAYLELVAPDEQRFLDLEHLEVVICDEPVVMIDGDV